MEDIEELELVDARLNATPVDVYIRVNMTKIFDLDTLNQRFQCEALIESKWYDSYLNSLNTSEIKWKPEFYIENAVNDPKEEVTHRILKDKSGKLFVSEIRKVRVLAWENLELESFPLDVQELSLVIGSKKTINKINLILAQPDMLKININSNLDKSMWYLHDSVRASKELLTKEYSFGVKQYPCVRITCQAFR